MSRDLTPEARYEMARANAGNALFCPLLSPSRSDYSRLPLFYDEAARLVRLLVQAGLCLRQDNFHFAISDAATALSMAMQNASTHTQCAEYMIYRLEGIPAPGGNTTRLDRLQAIAGTFYANLLVARSIERR